MTILITYRTGGTQVAQNIRKISQSGDQIELSVGRWEAGELSSEDLTLDRFEVLKMEVFLG